jgi:hypothetical protein
VKRRDSAVAQPRSQSIRIVISIKFPQPRVSLCTLCIVCNLKTSRNLYQSIFRNLHK